MDQPDREVGGARKKKGKRRKDKKERKHKPDDQQVAAAQASESTLTPLSLVSEMVGLVLEDTVVSELEDAFGSELEDAVGSELEDTVDSELEDAVGSELEGAVGYELESAVGSELKVDVYSELKIDVYSDWEGAVGPEWGGVLAPDRNMGSQWYAAGVPQWHWTYDPEWYGLGAPHWHWSLIPECNWAVGARWQEGAFAKPQDIQQKPLSDKLLILTTQLDEIVQQSTRFNPSIKLPPPPCPPYSMLSPLDQQMDQPRHRHSSDIAQPTSESEAEPDIEGPSHKCDDHKNPECSSLPRNKYSSVIKQTWQPETQNEMLLKYCRFDNCQIKDSSLEKIKQHEQDEHLRYYSRFIKCSVEDCCKYFSNEFNLSIHKQVHEQDYLEYCAFPNCGKVFMKSENLYKHLKAQHNIDKDTGK